MAEHHMEIEVKLLGGTHIKEAIMEAKELAIKLNLAYVCFNFNGTDVSVGQNVDIDAGVKHFEKNKGGFVILP
jgi:hypothetical protein